MIERIDYPTGTLRAGELQQLVVVAAEPISVQIKCFVRKPLPPRFRPCAECGSFVIRSGQAHWFSASKTIFEEAGGELRLHITDGQQDTRLLTLKVAAREEASGHGTPTVATS